MAKAMEEPWRMTFSEIASSAEELIEEARNGRMFVLVDDEDRENEGDLVIPAQMATPDAINFMARVPPPARRSAPSRSARARAGP